MPARPPDIAPDFDPVRLLPDAPVAAAWTGAGDALWVLGAEGQAWAVDPRDASTDDGWTAHEGGGFQLVAQPGGTRLASSGQDGRVAVWNAPGRLLAEARTGTAWVEHLRWSPTGRRLAAGAGRSVLILDEAGTMVRKLEPGRSTVAALAWDSAGRRLAVATYGGVQIYDVESGELGTPLEWRTSLISLAWSPDDRWLVAGTQEQAVQVWELPFRPGSELAMSGYPGKVRELAWHHGGRILATAGASAILAWNCGGRGPAGTTPRTLEGHAGRVNRLAFQHGGHLLASGGQEGSVLLWNAGKSSDPVRSRIAGRPVTVLEWSPDDSRLAVGGQDGWIGFTPSPSPGR